MASFRINNPHVASILERWQFSYLSYGADGEDFIMVAPAWMGPRRRINRFVSMVMSGEITD